VLCGEPDAGLEGWTAKLIDFGLAGPRSIASPRVSPKPARRSFSKAHEELLDEAIDTRPGAVGTPAFYGPETCAAQPACALPKPGCGLFCRATRTVRRAMQCTMRRAMRCALQHSLPPTHRHLAEETGRAAPTTAAQDAWSLGVTLAAAALGANPFARPNAAATRAAVLAGVGCAGSGGGGGGGGAGGGGLGADPLAPLSPALRHLLRCLLRADPILRLSCEAVLTHPWATAAAAAASAGGRGGGGVAGAGGLAEPSVASLARAERRHKWSADVVRQRFEHAGAEGARRGSVALGQAPGTLQKVLASVPTGMLMAAGRTCYSWRRDSA